MATEGRDRALEALRRANLAYREAELDRRNAIIEASQAGAALREISEAVEKDISPEVIRGVVGPRAGVAFEWGGDIFEISEPQTRALIYKADGYGAGAFPADVAKLDAGTDWLVAAAALGPRMRRVHVGLDAVPLRLKHDEAFALYQILRLTFMTGLTPIADLLSRLHNDFGSAALTTRTGRR